jgi:hypothetical protein
MKNDAGPESAEPKPDNKPGDIGVESAPAPKKREPYVKPAFRFEKVFVTSALSCGKMAGSGTCVIIKVS